jgi:hypothetical protein
MVVHPAGTTILPAPEFRIADQITHKSPSAHPVGSVGVTGALTAVTAVEDATKEGAVRDTALTR